MTTTKTAPARRKVVRSKSTTTEQAATDSTLLDVSDVKTLIPAPGSMDFYIGREIHGHADFDVFRAARKAKANILIEGPTGPGKTTAVQAYCAADGLPYYAVTSYAGKTLEQLVGGWKPDGKGGWTWVYGPVAILAIHGGVLLLNEVNFLHEKIVSGLFSLLRERTLEIPDHNGEVIKAHPDLQIIADMNPGYAGTRSLNPAFRNRFAIKLDWDYDPKIESKLIVSKSLLDLAQNLRRQTKEGNFDSPTTTNMLMEFEQFFSVLGWDFAAHNFAASYEDTEREAVSNLLDLNRTSIEHELKHNGAAPPPPDVTKAVFDDTWVWTFKDLEG